MLVVRVCGPPTAPPELAAAEGGGPTGGGAEDVGAGAEPLAPVLDATRLAGRIGSVELLAVDAPFTEPDIADVGRSWVLAPEAASDELLTDARLDPGAAAACKEADCCEFCWGG